MRTQSDRGKRSFSAVHFNARSIAFGSRISSLASCSGFVLGMSRPRFVRTGMIDSVRTKQTTSNTHAAMNILGTRAVRFGSLAAAPAANVSAAATSSRACVVGRIGFNEPVTALIVILDHRLGQTGDHQRSRLLHHRQRDHPSQDGEVPGYPRSLRSTGYAGETVGSYRPRRL